MVKEKILRWLIYLNSISYGVVFTIWRVRHPPLFYLKIEINVENNDLKTLLVAVD